MNQQENSRQFADKSTKAGREFIESGIWGAQQTTNGTKQSLSSSLANVRALNITLIDMAHANTEAVFELAHEIAGARAPSEVVAIWSAHASRQFEMMTKQARELTELGQKLASRSAHSLNQL